MTDTDRDEEVRSRLLAQTTALRQLYDEPDEEQAWVVDGLIAARSLNLFVAAPKVGKSTASGCLAYRVATGGTFLGRQCTQGSVIYVALEDRKTDVKKHFRSLGATGDEAIAFVFPERGKDVAALVPALAEVLHPELIIIDTLQRFINAPDLNHYAEVTRLMTPLLALSHHTAVLCVHHANKGFRKGVDAVLGSTALSGSPTVASIFGTNRPILGSAAEVGSTDPSGFGTEEAGRSRPARGGGPYKVRPRRQER